MSDPLATLLSLYRVTVEDLVRAERAVVLLANLVELAEERFLDGPALTAARVYLAEVAAADAAMTGVRQDLLKHWTYRRTKGRRAS